MKTIFIVIGKTTDRRIATLTDEYIGRIGHYMSFEMQVIPELRNAKNLSQEQQKAEEAELLKKTLQPGDYIVLLDEHGKERRSIDFASWMQKRMAAAPTGVHSWRSLRFCPTNTRTGPRGDFALANDLLPPDDKVVLCGTGVPRHDHHTWRTLPS